MSENNFKPLPLKRTNISALRSGFNFSSNEGRDIWLITLSDLLMLLVVFFVILFGMELQKHLPHNLAHAESKLNQLEKKKNSVSSNSDLLGVSASIEKDLSEVLDLEKGEQDITVKRIANLVTLTFSERIIFDPGDAQLKPSAQAALNKVAVFIKKRPDLNVEVQGYTDNRPINNARYPSNWELSVDRATQVAKAIISLGVNPSQFSVRGFGEYHSLYPNNSDANRFKNRRVEIQFLLPTK